MNPLSKSLWIIPAHAGAFIPFLKVQAFTSLGPAVKNVARPNNEYAALISLSRPLSFIPSSSKNNNLSS